MKISFERTGGFAGIRIPTTIDSETLPAHEVNQLRLLIDAADFFHLPTSITPPSPQPDRFQYRITVEDDHRQHSVLVSEQSVPSTLKPLLDWLQKAAASQH